MPSKWLANNIPKSPRGLNTCGSQNDFLTPTNAIVPRREASCSCLLSLSEIFTHDVLVFRSAKHVGGYISFLIGFCFGRQRHHVPIACQMQTARVLYYLKFYDVNTFFLGLVQFFIIQSRKVVTKIKPTSGTIPLLATEVNSQFSL